MPARFGHARHKLPFDRLDMLLVLAFLITVGPWITEITANPGSRYALTSALVEQRSVQLDDYRPLLQAPDFVEIDGHIYSDKAPVQPLLGVPVLAVAEAMGAPKGTEHRVSGNVGAWSQTIVFATLPGALLIPLMRRHARRYVGDRAATVAAVALGCTTMILLFSVNLFSHVFVAFLLLLAWHVVSGDRLGPRAGPLVAGVAAALAAGSEYPAAAIAAIIGLWVLTRRGVWAATRYSLPVLLVGVGVLAWNNLLYGSSATSYEQKSGSGVGKFINLPKPEHVIDILVGERGFIYTPIVFLAMIGLAVALVERRRDIMVPAAAFGFAFVLQAGWGNPWGGYSAAPRYILMGLPFLAYPLGVIVPRITPRMVAAFAAIGAVSMGLASITFQAMPWGNSLIFGHIERIRQIGLNPTIFTVGLGGVGWVLHGVLVAVALRATLAAWRSQFSAAPLVPTPQPSPA